MRRLLILLILFLPLTIYANNSAYLTGMRIQPGVNETRILFMLNKKTVGRVREYLQPKRHIVIEFKNTKKNFQISNAKLGNSNVYAINSLVTANGSVQIIFYLNHPITWTTKFLPDISGVILELRMISKKPVITPHKETQIKNYSLLQRKLELDIEAAIEEAKLTQNKHMNIAIKTQPLQPIKNVFTANKSQIFTVVIDPGHGGKDSGALGKGGLQEKNIALAIAQKLAYKLNQHSNVHAILTRDDDKFLSLRERLRFAREHNADLFIAVHADAYFENAAGASVYALSNRGATSEAARWLSKRENYSVLDDIELNELQDKSLMLRSVLIDLAQTATIKDSLRLGKTMLHNLNDITNLRSVRVEQAPFMVLKSPDIPSLLVETGFITNPLEAKRLATPIYQDKLAQALSLSVNQYIKRIRH